MYRNNTHIEHQSRLISKVCVRLSNVWEARLHCIPEIRNITDACTNRFLVIYLIMILFLCLFSGCRQDSWIQLHGIVTLKFHVFKLNFTDKWKEREILWMCLEESVSEIRLFICHLAFILYFDIYYHVFLPKFS